MIPDYFVVGPRLALRTATYLRPQSQFVVPKLEFAILEPGPSAIGSALVELSGQTMHITLRWQTAVPSDTDQVEAMRLLANVCRKLTPAEIVLDGEVSEASLELARNAGFEPNGENGWRCPFGTLSSRPKKAGSVAECSDDPFDVPWNLEPRQWELLGPFLADMRETREPILEIGCGFGRNAVLLEEWNLKVYGIDVSVDAVRQSRRWVRHPERFVAASICNLPYADASFEGVLDVGCLHCSGNDTLVEAIDEIARVLRPSGRLYSRFFKPRSTHWLGSQPYRTESVGLNPGTLVQLLERRFMVTAWEEPEMTCVRAVPRTTSTAPGANKDASPR